MTTDYRECVRCARKDAIPGTALDAPHLCPYGVACEIANGLLVYRCQQCVERRLGELRAKGRAVNRAQRAELSAARKVLERPDDLSDFEVETAAAKVRALEQVGADSDPVCPFCDRRVSTHIASDAPRDRHGQLIELGASLCPVVRDNGRLGRPERGEKTGWTYYSTPTREQIAAWRASHAGPKPPTREERREETRRKQGTLL